MVGSSLSSSSSSLDHWWEFCELICMVDEAHQHYSNATYEVGQLEHCLDAIGVVLAASERETTAAQVLTTDTQARIMGEGSLHLVMLSDICSF
jgi:hypothetical protein